MRHVLPNARTDEGLEVDHLSHAYGQRRVVENVQFRMGSGEVHCLVGPSGCGKTTILRLIAGLEAIQDGEITIDGEIVASRSFMLPPEHRRVGLMFQDFALFPHLCVLDNVGFGLRNLPVRKRRQRALELLAQVDLAGHADAFPHMLSGGEQQRVALARALAPAPRLMLLDEPFSSLDATLREQLRHDTIALLRAANTPVLIVTHDAEEAVSIADRIHVMLDGHIVQSGSAAELYRQPANPFVAGFFGVPNRFKGWVLAGQVDTPLGRLPADGFEDGTAVDILVRPEALQPAKASQPTERACFKINRIRDLGTNRVLELQIPEGPILSVRMAGRPAVAAGDIVTVDVDLDQVHIYRATWRTKEHQ